MNMTKLRTGVALAAMLCCSGLHDRIHAQTAYTVGVCAMGMGMHWLGYSAEVTVYRPDSVSRLRSVHLAVSLGAPTLNATYVPLEIRTVLFPGHSHLEVAAGVSFQIAYSDRMLDATFQDVPS